MKTLLTTLLILFANSLFAQAFISIGSGAYLAQETGSISPSTELAAGYRSDWKGISISGNDNIQRVTFDTYPANWLNLSIGLSNRELKGSDFSTNSTGVSAALAVEIPVSRSLKIGLKGTHDLHGDDTEGPYKQLGGTTASVFLKFIVR